MIDKRIDGSPADQLRLRHLRHRLGRSPWLDRGLCPASDHHVQTRVFINTNSDLYQDHGGIVHEARGSTLTLPSGDHAVFPNSKLVSATTTSSSIALTIPLVKLCEIECTTTMQNFVDFRWRNLQQSTIYRSPVKSEQESGRV